MPDVALALSAFFAGVLMFLAPCTLPIVPGYIAFVGGAGGRIVRNALFFVLGFTVVFVFLGASAGLFGLILGSWRAVLAQGSGAVLILFGLLMLGVVRLPFISAEHHPTLSFLTPGSVWASFLIGALFAFGWSPCIGPILGTILFVASVKATAIEGALLLLVYSMGLGIPFVLTALMLERAQVFANKTARAAQILSYIGGAFLVVLGLLILSGHTALLVEWGYKALNFIHYDRLLNYL